MRVGQKRTLIVEVHLLDPPIRSDPLKDLPPKLLVDLPHQDHEDDLADADDGGDDDEQDLDVGALVVFSLDLLDFGDLEDRVEQEGGVEAAETDRLWSVMPVSGCGGRAREGALGWYS